MSTENVSNVKSYYCGGILSAAIPAEAFMYVNNMTGRVMNGKDAYHLTAIVWLMNLFSNRREFHIKDLSKAIGVNDKVISRLLKYGEGALFDVDREKYAAHKGGYEYRLKEDLRKLGGMPSTYEYNFNGTVFGEVFDLLQEYKAIEVIPACPDPKWPWDSAGGYYLSPYWKLSFRFSHDAMNDIHVKFKEADKAGVLMKHFPEAPSYKSGRIYHAFHYVPRCMRDHLECDGSPITELFDLHASFFTLLSSMIRDQLPEKEFNELFDECFSGGFYTNIADYIGTSKEDAKDVMQGWRNVCSVAFLHNSPKYAKAAEYMEKKYPVFSKTVYEWNFIETKDGVKKTIQQDCGAYETKVFSAFAEYLVSEYGITPYTLHDAIYCTKSDKEKLPDNIDDIMRDWFLKKLKY